MSYADVRNKLAELRREPRPKLPPRKPAPEGVKEQLERIKAEIAKRRKDGE